MSNLPADSPVILGISPTLPPVLNNWRWLTAPVRAERAAAFRIAVGLVLLIDVLVFYLPDWRFQYGPDGMATAEVYSGYLPRMIPWTWLRHLPPGPAPLVMLIVWALAALGLTLGYRPRLMALTGWALATSFFVMCPAFHNGGDRVKITALLFLAFLPTDGAWAIRRHPLARHATGAVWVRPWPMRLMFVQLATIYFFNGYHKIISPVWQNGTVLHYVVNDVAWTHFSGEYLSLSPFVLAVLTRGTLIWELFFPLFVALKPSRNLALITGVIFHLLTFVHLEVGLFPIYALCGYVPFLPWESWGRAGKPVVGHDK